MQVVLCGALGLTIALAWWVERTHAAALAFTLGPVQRFINNVASLDIRVPVGWRATVEEDEPGEAALLAAEGKPRYGRSREVILRVHRIASRVPLPSPEDAAATVMEGQLPVRPPEKLDFLGVPGTLIEYAPVEGEIGGADGRPPALCACAVIADPRIAVSIELIGVHTFAAADVDLVRSLAKALTLADLTHPIPLLPNAAEMDWRASPKTQDPKAPKPDNPDSP
jgi:hypothetical protein